MSRRLVEKKIFGIFLSLTILMSSSIIFISNSLKISAIPPSVWDGTVATSFAGGSGKGADPYLISTPEQLAYLGSIIQSNPGDTWKTYKLTQDIYLNNVTDSEWSEKSPHEWTYGTSSGTGKIFYGTFDGNGHTIKGIYIKENASTYSGLFPGITGMATIKNTGFSDAHIKGNYAGAVAGIRVAWNYDSGCAITQCFSDSSVTLSGGVSGGLLGTALEKTTITDSFSTAVLGGSSPKSGGLIGDLYLQNVVTVKTSYNSQGTAPMIGNVSFYASYTNCYTTGESQASLKKINAEEMIGISAKTNMANLDFGSIWNYKTNSTPKQRVFNNGDPDQSAPDFSGIINLDSKTTTSLSISWPAAYDDITISQDIVYNIYYDDITITEAALSSATKAGTVTGSKTFTINNLSAATTYYVAVTATDKTGKATILLAEPFSTLALRDTTPPIFTGDISMSTRSISSLTLSWTAASDNVTVPTSIIYQLYYSLSPITSANLSSATKSVGVTGGTSGTITGLTKGTSYFVAVTASDAENNSTLLAAGPFLVKEAVWNGTVAASFTGGNGSAADPYQIATAEQLAYLGSIVQTASSSTQKYYKLTQDIYLNDVTDENWKNNLPREWIYGTFEGNSKTFYGTLDGNGHVIKGIYINESAKNYSGLFPIITGGATVKNLGITDSYIKSVKTNVNENVGVGAISGLRFSWSNGSGSVIQQCYSDASTVLEGPVTGGLLGSVSELTTIRDCYSKAVLNGTIKKGGLVGDLWQSNFLKIYTSYNTQVDVPLVGNYSERATYTNCFTLSTEQAGLTKLTEDAMFGSGVRTTMSGFDFGEVWNYSEATSPILRIFNNDADIKAPDFTGGFIIENRTTTSLSFQWPAAYDDKTKSSQIKYDYYYATSEITISNLTQAIKGTTLTGKTSATIEGLDIGKTYYVAATATDAVGKTTLLSGGAFSTLQNADTISPVFRSVVSLQEKKDTSLTFSWETASDNVTLHTLITYTLYYSTLPITAETIGTAHKSVTVTGTLSGKVEGLTSGVAYYVAVVASDTAGNTTAVFAGPFKTKLAGIWDGSIASLFAGGSGTQTSPYQIENGEQLALLCNTAKTNSVSTDGKYYILTADISLNDVSSKAWLSEGPTEWIYGTGNSSSDQAFRGTLDGNGHVIKGIYIQSKASFYSGLFVSLTGEATVKNLGIIHSYITCFSEVYDNFAGAIAGQRFGWTKGKGVTISQCFSDSSVTIVGKYVGGILGNARQKTTIQDCFSDAVLEKNSTTASSKGGILGNIWESGVDVTLIHCYNAQVGIQMVGNLALYSDCKESYTIGKAAGGAIKLGPSKMQGTLAKTYMVGFDFESIWKTVDSKTPVLRIFNSDLYASRIPEYKVTISFVTNGGKSIEPISGYPGQKISWPTATREGCNFDGWFVYPELDVPFPYDYYPEENVKLYAKWDKLYSEQNFEDYPYFSAGSEGLGWDYVFYRPGVRGYTPSLVVEGGKCIYRVGAEDGYQEVLLFDDTMKPLEKGKEYVLTFWINVESAQDAKEYIKLVHTNNLDVFKNSIGAENICKLESIQTEKWEKITYKFVASGKYLSISTPGKSSIYLDDILIMPTGLAGNAKNPDTGVRFPLLLFFILLMFSAMVLIAFYQKGRRKKVL